MTRILIAGAGMAAVECALAVRAVAGASIDIELLAPAAELVHRPSSVETPFGGDPAPRIDLEGLTGPTEPHWHCVCAAVLAIGRQHCRRRSFQQRPQPFDPSLAHLRERNGKHYRDGKDCHRQKRFIKLLLLDGL